MPKLRLDTDIYPLGCAIPLSWNEGVDIRGIPLKSEIKGGWLCQSVDDKGKPTRVVKQVDGGRFSEFWLSRQTLRAWRNS